MTIKRVLAIDDDPALLITIQQMLKGSYDVVVAQGGLKGLEVLDQEEGCFDLIISDLSMPVINGATLYLLVKERYPGLENNIIFITGRGFGRYIDEFNISHDNICINKPFSREELLQGLSSVLQHSVWQQPVANKDTESGFEDVFIQKLADFILNLGDDFALIGRKRCLNIDGRSCQMSLLFFHRSLKCLVIIDVKFGKFSKVDASKMHLCLEYAREHWIKPEENPPIGLILSMAEGAYEAHYALEGLADEALVARCLALLPDEKWLADEMGRIQGLLSS